MQPILKSGTMSDLDFEYARKLGVTFPIVHPSVDQMLGEIGPCPMEALILGMCSDSLPVLINLEDTHTPFFLRAPEGWGKTHFLKTTLEFAWKMYLRRPRQLHVIVLSDRVDEWDDMLDKVMVQEITRDTLQLVMLGTEKLTKVMNLGTYALILIDGWETLTNWMPGDYFLDFMCGQTRRVKTIITSRGDAPSDQRLNHIWSGFQRGQFVTMEGSVPIHFLVPSL